MKILVVIGIDNINNYYDTDLKFARPVKFPKRPLFHRARLAETGILGKN